MTPFEIIAATWRKPATRILAPFVALALLPIIVVFMAFHLTVCAGFGVLTLCLSLAWEIGEFNRDRRMMGWTVRKALGERLRFQRGELAAWLHAHWLDLREYVGKRWRRVLAWFVIVPLIGLVALPLVLLRDGLAKLADWADIGTDALCNPIKRHIGTPLYKWSAR